MNIYKIFGILVGFIILFIIVWFVAVTMYFASIRQAVKSYDGDGVIKDISWLFLVFPIGGYEIHFDTFDLGYDQEGLYSISSLPLTGRAVVYLLIEDEDRWRNEDIALLRQGNLELEIIDNHGNKVLSSSNALSDMTWTSESGGMGLYVHESSAFYPKKKNEYTLKLHYSGEELLDGISGRIYIRSGGSI